CVARMEREREGEQDPQPGHAPAIADANERGQATAPRARALGRATLLRDRAVSSTARIRAVRILLTVSAFEFFGPIFRDYSPSHAFNPTWVGHARVHLVWLLGFMFFSGLANLWLIWFRRPRERRNLWLSVVWQACNLGGFWAAATLAPSYGGLIVV